MPRFPQAKRNVAVSRRELPQAVLDEVDRLNAELGEGGRVLVRPSGTEPRRARPGRGGKCGKMQRNCVLASPRSWNESSAEPDGGRRRALSRF